MNRDFSKLENITTYHFCNLCYWYVIYFFVVTWTIPFTRTGDKIATNWTWRRTQVWEELKKKFAKFSPQRGHTEGLWALRDNVVARRHAYLASTSFACKGLKRLSSRHRVGLLRYMLHFDRGMKMPSGVQPIMWELPDGTQLRLGSELSECTEILWRSAPDYIEGGDRQASWRQQRTTVWLNIVPIRKH